MGQTQTKPKPAFIPSFSNDQIDAIRRQNVPVNMFDICGIENGIDVDYYPPKETLDVDGLVVYYAQGPKPQIKPRDQEDQLDSGKPKLSAQTILEKFPQTKIASKDAFLFDYLNIENKINDQNYLLLYLTNNYWIHSQLPNDQIIDYTGTILTNDSIKGLQHTFVRHWDQWVEHIPGLDPIMQKLKFIKLDLENIKDAKNRNSTYDAVNQLVETLSKLNNNDLLGIKCALLEAQFEIFKFLKINLNSNSFRSNDQVKGRLYFDVQDLEGNKRVMVVCLSREFFPVVEEFSDPRQVRLIITIYFLTEQEFFDL